MKPARILVCERDGKWAAWMRNPLSPRHRILQLRNLDQCEPELVAAPCSVLCLEARPRNLLPMVELMVELQRSPSGICLMVLASRALRQYEWTWRAAGAIHVAFGYDQAIQAAHIARRHLSAVPEPPQTLRQRIFRRIPW